ncbi:MAG: CcdB family protein [Rhodoferax sp.]
MAQFDVHRNMGALRESIPFVVLVQSAQFDRYSRRVVVPLVRRSALPANLSVATRLNPVLTVQGVELVLHTLHLVSAPVDQIGQYVASLAEQGQSITDALDELLTRSWE